MLNKYYAQKIFSSWDLIRKKNNEVNKQINKVD